MKHSLLMGAYVLCFAVAAPAFAFDGWHQENAATIESKTSAFDYVAFDAGTNRLFIGHRQEGLQVFDLAAHKLMKVVGDTTAHSANGATLMPEFDLGIANNEDGTITPFKISTLEAQPSLKVSEEIDASHYDPASKHIFVNAAAGKDGQDIVVLDAPSLKVAGTIRAATAKAEGADVDGKGNLYLAEQDLAKIAVIDTKAMKVTAEWETTGCGKPTAVASDAVNKRLFVGCRSKGAVKPALIVINTETGKIIYAAEIGDGVDGTVYDAELKRIFVASGVNATLSVFEQQNADTYKLVETLATRQWVKVLAMDRKAKKLYSIVAEGSADAGKKINTAVSPYYPNTVFPNTFTVLTYSK
ncbi:hypothetical protein SAMN05519103_07714 [Rhizobiales bacterium GAS113]|nr:hypothetical protein SAMN05519103_07714 [Rhizobiales bacterium GAS113]